MRVGSGELRTEIVDSQKFYEQEKDYCHNADCANAAVFHDI